MRVDGPTPMTRIPLRRAQCSRRGKVVLTLALLLCLTHPWWLGVFGEFLGADAPVDSASTAIVLSGDHRLQRAAELWRNGDVSEIRVLEREAGYAVSVGILPPVHAAEVEELVSLGVPAERIRVLAGQVRDIDDAGRALADLLRREPKARFVVLCHQPQCLNLQMVLSRAVGPRSRERIGVMGVRPAEYDAGSWWRSRSGWKETFSAVCDLVFTVLHGVDSEPERVVWNADELERRFLSLDEGSGCGD